VVHITDAIIDTRAQKMVSHTAVHITEMVFAHDQLEGTTVSSFTRAQQVISCTAAHHRIGACT